jgi:hypothetical protein
MGNIAILSQRAMKPIATIDRLLGHASTAWYCQLVELTGLILVAGACNHRRHTVRVDV